jgi:tripartite-type tricarboxylate transporter receptor subunit TctC
VPTSSGTGADITSRLVGPKLSERLNRPVVVENRTGASGSIGIGAVAKAAPDGATVLVTPSSMAVLPHLSKSVNWDPITDFAPVARLAGNILAVVVGPNVQANSVSELIALARSQPGKLNYATPGVGTPHHLVTEMFKQATGVNIVHIPYKTSAAAITDLAGGQVNVGFFPLHSALSLAKAGKLRFFATVSDARTPWTPDIPTLRESGVENVFSNTWTAVFLPRAASREIVNSLSKDLLAILAQPGMTEALQKDGLLNIPGGPEELAAMLKKDITVWGKVIKEANITAE